MKHIIIAVILLIVTAMLLKPEATQPITEEQITTEQKAPESTKQEPKPVEKSEAELRKELIANNPEKCDLSYQVILWPDGECKGEKPTPAPVATSPSQSASTSAPVQVAYNGSIEALIRSYDWNDEVALAVARCESGLNPGAIGDNYPINGLHLPSYGVFQIRGFADRGTPAQLLDPEYNVRFAYDMYRSQGWQPWTCATKLGYA